MLAAEVYACLPCNDLKRPPRLGFAMGLRVWALLDVTRWAETWIMISFTRLIESDILRYYNRMLANVVLWIVVIMKFLNCFGDSFWWGHQQVVIFTPDVSLCDPNFSLHRLFYLTTFCSFQNTSPDVFICTDKFGVNPFKLMKNLFVSIKILIDWFEKMVAVHFQFLDHPLEYQ